MTVKANTKRKSSAWLIIAGLFLLSAIPMIAGASRLNQLVTGAEITPSNARFFAMPWPVVIHIVGAAVYALVGAFQFVTGWRRRAFGWHRAAGRVLVACGLAVGLSGLWMTLFYPYTGALTFVTRLFFGSAMVVSIVLGFAAIIRGRDVLSHRAWMMRAYAIGLGAGTQALTGMAEYFLVSQRTELSTGLSLAAGWIINLLIAEWAIRRLPAHRAAVAQATRLKSEQPGAAQ
jgi:uncharacterized membrane protein